MSRVGSVVFVTTVMPPARTGPATFAGYMRAHFENDGSDVDFHVVGPAALPSTRRSSSAFYADLSDRAVDLARTLPSGTIIHANNTFPFVSVAKRWPRTIVQVNDYTTAMIWRTLRRKARSADPRGCAAVVARHWRERSCLLAAELAICNSSTTASHIVKAYPVARERVVVINKAVDVEHFARPDGGVPVMPWPLSDTPRVLFIGSDWDVKGLDTLLQAVSLLVDRGSVVQLVVAGEAPPRMRSRYQSVTARLGIADRVHFQGAVHHDSLRSWLWSADVMAMPSREEAFGVAALEAMAAGVPVVVADRGGLSEIMRGGVGLKVPPSDPGAWADALRQAIDTVPVSDAQRMGPVCAARYSLPRMAERYSELYRALLCGQ